MSDEKRPRFLNDHFDYEVKFFDKKKAKINFINVGTAHATSARQALCMVLGLDFALVNVLTCTELNDDTDTGVMNYGGRIYLTRRYESKR